MADDDNDHGDAKPSSMSGARTARQKTANVDMASELMLPFLWD
jgi:hypothetical protein